VADPRRWVFLIRAPAPATVGSVGICVVALFVLGVLIAGVAVVDPPSLSSAGGGGPFRIVGQRFCASAWFLGQGLTGPLGLISAWIGQGVANDYPAAKARLGEIGTLYTAVAGMLNLLAIIDASHRAATK
jgi:hypothetical protein